MSIEETDSYDQYDTASEEAVARSGQIAKVTINEPCKKYFRICPPIEKGPFFEPYGAHYALGALIPAAPVFVCACLKITLQQVCPVCIEVRRMYAEAEEGATRNEALRGRASRHRGKPRFAMNVVDLELPDLGVLVWDVNKEVIAWIKEIFLTKNKFIVSPHPEKGRAVEVTFSRSERWVRPTRVDIADNPKWIGAIPVDGWPEKRHDLKAFIQRITFPATTIREWMAESATAEAMAESRHVPVDNEFVVDGENGAEPEEAPLTPDVLNDPELKATIARLQERHAKRVATN
jgi:hypothetical protein